MNQGYNPNSQPPDLQTLIEQFLKQIGGVRKLIMPLIILVIISGFFSSYYTVGPDEEAVIIRLGRYNQTYSSGLHFKIPYGIDVLKIVKTTKVHQAEFGFRTQSVSQTGRTQYSRRGLGNESLMLTGDLNIADVEWVVQYKISDAYKYLFKGRNPIQNVRDVSESIMRRVVGDQLVNNVLTTGRAQIEADAKRLMQEVLDNYDIGIVIAAVKLQDVNPPESVKRSFNEVNEAKQEQEKWINQAEEKYNKVIPEARGFAEKKISEARGFAVAQINRAKGDASRFNAVLTEYKKAPSITRKRLYLEAMEDIYKNFKDLTIVDSKIKGLLPVFKGLGETK